MEVILVFRVWTPHMNLWTLKKGRRGLSSFGSENNHEAHITWRCARIADSTVWDRSVNCHSWSVSLSSDLEAVGRRLRTLLTKRFLRPLVLLGDKAFLKQLSEGSSFSHRTLCRHTRFCCVLTTITDPGSQCSDSETSCPWLSDFRLRKTLFCSRIVKEREDFSTLAQLTFEAVKLIV